MRESDIGVTSVTIKHLQIRPKRIIKMWQKKGSNMIVIDVSIKQNCLKVHRQSKQKAMPGGNHFFLRQTSLHRLCEVI